MKIKKDLERGAWIKDPILYTCTKEKLRKTYERARGGE